MQVPWKISINLWEKKILHHIIISDISHLEFLEIQKLRHVPNTSKVFDEWGSFLNPTAPELTFSNQEAYGYERNCSNLVIYLWMFFFLVCFHKI